MPYRNTPSETWEQGVDHLLLIFFAYHDGSGRVRALMRYIQGTFNSCFCKTIRQVLYMYPFWIGQPSFFKHLLISSHLSPLTLEVAGAPQMTLHIPFLPSLSSAALRESPNPIPVHSLMLSSHLFFCLPLLLAPFTVPCRIVFAMPEDL